MNVTVKVVGTNNIQQFWPQVKDFIGRALDEGMPYPEWANSYSLDHIQLYLTSGEWILLIASDDNNNILGAATIAFTNYPLHRVAVITSTGGKFIVNKDVTKQVKEIVKYYGATKLQAYCRKSMVRLMNRCGYETRNTLVEILV